MATLNKQNIADIIEFETNLGNAVPTVINGGGFSWVSSNDAEDFVAGFMGDDYAEPQQLEPGEEFPDFIDFVKPPYYADFTWFRIPHHNGYNQENNDIQVGILDINLIEFQK